MSDVQTNYPLCPGCDSVKACSKVANKTCLPPRVISITAWLKSWITQNPQPNCWLIEYVYGNRSKQAYHPTNELAFYLEGDHGATATHVYRPEFDESKA